MCFNAAVMQKADLVEELYGARFLENRFEPSYFRSAFDHPSWPVLKQGETDEFRPLVWGLVPRWTRSAEAAASVRDRTINARFETLDVKPSFRSLVNRNRCGMLVDGFVEWRHFEGKKYPYHIGLPENRPFLLAGVWDRWEDPGSDTVLESFSVVTVAARGLPAQIHNTKLRMPLILGKNTGALWLDPSLPYTEIRQDMHPVSRALVAWPVTRRLSIPGEEKNLPGIRERVDYPELPDLVPPDD